VPYGEQGVAGKRVVAVDDTETDERVDRDLQRAWGVRSVMLAPILVRDTVVAGLFFNYGAPHRFSELEIDFATKAAALVTAALENARLYDSQRRVAVTLQESFLHELPAVAGMEIGVSSQTAYEPDLVGGDFHDVFELARGRVLVLVGDVEGKGVRAAGLTETVRSSVRALALVDPSPGRILGKANQLLLTEQQQQFVTAALVLVDVGREVATFASAGHPAPLLIGATGGAEVQVPAGTPLGAFGWSYGEATVELARGDTVVLYTDGLTEARREGELFGSERALRMALDHRDDDPERLAEALRAAASAFGGRLADDLQVVAFRLTGGF
jgi:serine phosphatase RsbU (regulator of sigma subunit)